MTNVVVLGLGDVTAGDAAFGPFVVRSMHARYELPAGIRLLDSAEPACDPPAAIAGAVAVILVDAIITGGPPGMIRCYRKADLLYHRAVSRDTPLQATLIDVLSGLELQALAPADVLFIGVTSTQFEAGAPLSPHARLAAHDAIALIVCELERLGYPPSPRASPERADIWWEKPRRRAAEH
jgi:hydrogenase maturation protease